MLYTSTRNNQINKSYDNVLLEGLSSDGGLFIPKLFPSFSYKELQKMASMDYITLAASIMEKFTGDNLNFDSLLQMCEVTYSKFNNKEISPIRKISDNDYLLELFHGPTLAFKDYAMQYLARDFERAIKNNNNKALILGATSGDTGSAALNAFAGNSNIDIFILFPRGRVSPIQEAQMTSVIEDGAHAIQVDGDFDQCQAIVKEIFSDISFRERVNLSAINSINWARLMPQIVYYFYSAFKLGSPDQKVSFSVPTGNFGNIYAGWCASKLGLPIDRLICASNRNNILTRFFKTGEMERRVVEQSLSPSMDIQVSSNFERLLYDIYNEDSIMVKSSLESFNSYGKFEIKNSSLNKLSDFFSSYYLSDEGILNEIKRIYEKTKILIDPHTACGTYAALKSRENCEVDTSTPIITLACAHPSKFPDAVKRSVNLEPKLPEILKGLLKKPTNSLYAPSDSSTIKSLIEGYRRV